MVEAQGFVNLIREDCRGVGWQSYEEEALWSKHQAEGKRTGKMRGGEIVLLGEDVES
jgi:hypothetical protein